MRVLDVAASRTLDRRASEEFGIPSLVLMENAALGVVEALDERFPEAQRVLILCGPGNNGGDGLAVARHLHLHGVDVEVLLVGDGRLGGDAAAQEAICRRQGVAVRRMSGAEGLPTSGEGWDVIVDALFGVGLSRPLAGVYADLAVWQKEQSAPCLAVDLPSGLAGDESEPLGEHFIVDSTVTFETPKPAHVLPPACNAVGDLFVAPLGVPPVLTASLSGDLELVTEALAADWLGARPASAHKGDFGHVLVVAGSLGMGGAAVLAARGAIRGGAGLVTCGVPRSVLPTVDAASLESMTLGLPTEDDGRWSRAALDEVVEAAEERDMVALGPGLGDGDDVGGLVLGCLEAISRPMVLDASGLAPLAGRLALLKQRSGPIILTPHAGELARLLGISVDEVVADRLSAVRRARDESGATVLLKGQATLVAGGDGVSINSTGNPGMATGGTGDVLTGLIAALWAGGLAPQRAAALGAFVHGAAGDIAAAGLGQTALAASDLLSHLPEVLLDLESA